jgi:hypothetical protein
MLFAYLLKSQPAITVQGHSNFIWVGFRVKIRLKMSKPSTHYPHPLDSMQAGMDWSIICTLFTLCLGPVVLHQCVFIPIFAEVVESLE